MAGRNLEAALIIFLLVTLPLRGESSRVPLLRSQMKINNQAERREGRLELLRKELWGTWRNRVMAGEDYKRMVPGGPDPQHHSSPEAAH
ncbi:unnamed protein product [Spirodela intermedia]|uniref:Uncharacterized protein n=2 Tax=Spirodela intermedia TaxID=51605 RepID=A0A7I8KZ15_SPIIN|nr:unnamed protein product [Spirodela intermedia]CAA6665819.1 unnamed protein product [Spirodela intermedia]CAA7402576.1 unnamed protein product [Spirodela intermedia]